MPNIKKCLRHIFLVFFSIGIMLFIGIISSILFLMFDREGYCLSEEGGVWDDNQKICRQDCLTWNKKDGCIPITEENIRKKEQGEL